MNERAQWHQIARCMNKVSLEKVFINDGQPEWRASIDKTEEELKSIVPDYEKKTKYKFVQTIPVSKSALNVTFNIRYQFLNDERMVIIGETNLFDGATLLISLIYSDGHAGPSCKVKCKDGMFQTEALGKTGEKIEGTFTVKITLSVSSTQDIDFVKKAGMQYENLTGEFIQRGEFGSPTGKIEIPLVLKD